MATKRAKKEETTTAFRSFIRQIETRNVRNVAFLFLLLLLSLRPSLDRPPLPSPRRGHRDGEIKRRRGRMRNMIKKKKKREEEKRNRETRIWNTDDRFETNVGFYARV